MLEHIMYNYDTEEFVQELSDKIIVASIGMMDGSVDDESVIVHLTKARLALIDLDEEEEGDYITGDDAVEYAEKCYEKLYRRNFPNDQLERDYILQDAFFYDIPLFDSVLSKKEILTIVRAEIGRSRAIMRELQKAKILSS